jgi:cyclic-di-GMP-binding protein
VKDSGTSLLLQHRGTTVPDGEVPWQDPHGPTASLAWPRRPVANGGHHGGGGDNLMSVAAESSFDIVSKINHQEVDNALNQTVKEVGTRFDFRGVGASITWSGKEAVEIKANSEERAKAVLDVFKDKLVKRSVSLKVLDSGEPQLSGKEYRLHVGLKEGISQDDARKISKIIRDEGPKGVRAQVQGDELRVSSKKKDELQDVQALLKGKDFDIALQFVNYR